MDLKNVLEKHRYFERSSNTIIHFTKPIWNDAYFEINVNKLPEEILMKWLSVFLQNLQNGTDVPCTFGGNTSFGRKIMPLHFKICSNSIEVSYIITDKKGDIYKTQLFLIIDGTQASIRKFKKALIHDNTERFQIYSPRKYVYCTKV